jgi:hypothetical protein
VQGGSRYGDIGLRALSESAKTSESRWPMTLLNRTSFVVLNLTAGTCQVNQFPFIGRFHLALLSRPRYVFDVQPRQGGGIRNLLCRAALTFENRNTAFFQPHVYNAVCFKYSPISVNYSQKCSHETLPSIRCELRDVNPPPKRSETRPYIVQ